jgi:hypothetical protein
MVESPIIHTLIFFFAGKLNAIKEKRQIIKEYFFIVLFYEITALNQENKTFFIFF